MLLSMMKLTLGKKDKIEYKREKANIDAVLNRNFVNLDKQREYQRWPDKRPTQETFLLCDAIKQDKINEYLGRLEKKRKKQLIRIFLGIVHSKSSGLPILCDEEMPAVIIDGTTFDPIQNVQARMMTKITLLMLVEKVSQKLGVWNQLQQQWTEKYLLETKTYVQILEVLVQQCENSAHTDKIPELRHSIELIKDSNRQYAINW